MSSTPALLSIAKPLNGPHILNRTEFGQFAAFDHLYRLFEVRRETVKFEAAPLTLEDQGHLREDWRLLAELLYLIFARIIFALRGVIDCKFRTLLRVQLFLDEADFKQAILAGSVAIIFGTAAAPVALNLNAISHLLRLLI